MIILDDSYGKDELTSVYTRKSIFEYANSLIDDKIPFSMIMCDIDNFKYVNDTYGHVVGDVVLKKCSQNLMELVGNQGYIGRYGGDEFVIIVPNIVDYDEIWQFARKINLGCNKTAIEEIKGNSITFTLGIARYTIDGENMDELFAKADKALYRGKQKGRNCFIIYLHEKHANINTSDSSAVQYNSSDLHHKIAQILTASYDLKDNIHTLSTFLSTTLMIDHLCVQSNTDIKDSAIHSLSYVKEFKAISAELLGTYVNSSGFCHINELSVLQTVGLKELHDEFAAQGISGCLFVKIACFDKDYGYLRADSTTPDGRIWQSRDTDLLIMYSRMLGMMLYYNNTDLDELFKA